MQEFGLTADELAVIDGEPEEEDAADDADDGEPARDGGAEPGDTAGLSAGGEPAGDPGAEPGDTAGLSAGGEPAGDPGAEPGDTAGLSAGEVAYHTRVIDAALPAIDRADLDLGGLALSELLAARDRALDP